MKNKNNEQKMPKYLKKYFILTPKRWKNRRKTWNISRGILHFSKRENYIFSGVFYEHENHHFGIRILYELVMTNYALAVDLCHHTAQFGVRTSD
jgi:hypothetical protein